MADELDLDKLEALEKAATPGLWELATSQLGVLFVRGDSEGETTRSYLIAEVRAVGGRRQANGDLLVSIRNATPELIRRARRLAVIEKRLGDVTGFECGHGVLLTKPCKDCGAGALEER